MTSTAERETVGDVDDMTTSDTVNSLTEATTTMPNGNYENDEARKLARVWYDNMMLLMVCGWLALFIYWMAHGGRLW